jgi:hypothetical protein
MRPKIIPGQWKKGPRIGKERKERKIFRAVKDAPSFCPILSLFVFHLPFLSPFVFSSYDRVAFFSLCGYFMEGPAPLSLGRSMGPSAYSCWAMDAPRGHQRSRLAAGSWPALAAGRAGRGGAGRARIGGRGAGSGHFWAQPANLISTPSQLLPLSSGLDRLRTCCHEFGLANILLLFSSAG